ncbi:MAG: NADH-quinone oxidoreductase subunit H [Thermoplasmata archaeon]|uniref:NADH-quinone oxidoreductase subunit H n=1 Tax=Candidatus Sysuiplasma superficiale TaxID=2823368 RepID=A0A8J7YR92_9ARCH|nr:NADH-quinone oxidoreductase subunit H [Candidatus Sysuiplasma superficiale]MBX8643139.1 NADH-quinone oxidoreductase subunit H [Candidatus Sysuiplasma superficiale]MCL4346929.1 NADH-quinone oxidoreductase subunit H [Candidatus Thermoplasmatota archaeon]
MFAIWTETVIQLVGVLLLSPLVAGVLARIKARIESRKGVRVIQPYFDLAKLLRKEDLISSSSTVVFSTVPFVVFGIYILISFIIPVVAPFPVLFTPSADFLGGALLFALASFLQVLAGINSGSQFTRLGSSRSVVFSAFAEPTLVMVFFAVAIISGTNNPYVTNEVLVSSVRIYLSLPHLLSTAAFFMLLLFETGKLPVESQSLNELGMIDEGRLYEYSGRNLFLLKYSSMMKQYLLGSVFLNVFLIPWFMQYGIVGTIADIPIMLAKWLLLIAIIAVIEETVAKLRLFKIQDFLSVSFALALLSIITYSLGGII